MEKIFELLLGYPGRRNEQCPNFIQISIVDGRYIVTSGAIRNNLNQITPGDMNHLSALLERVKGGTGFIFINGVIESGLVINMPNLSKLPDSEFEKLTAIIRSIVKKV